MDAAIRRSGKQRRAEILAARRRRQNRQSALAAQENRRLAPLSSAPVDASLLLPINSDGAPEFVSRGYYLDQVFRCIDCAAEGIWYAERQKWWYEVVGGHPCSIARRCAACRAKERQRKALARQQSGVAANSASSAPAARQHGHDPAISGGD